MNQIKTEIHLFRHGETTWNVEGRFQGLEISKLTKRGVLQAQNLGEKLKDTEFDKIYSSPSLRTKQTANAIWPDKADKIIYLDDLVEIKLGKLEGKLYSDIKKNDFIDSKTKKKIPDETINLLQIQKELMMYLTSHLINLSKEVITNQQQ